MLLGDRDQGEWSSFLATYSLIDVGAHRPRCVLAVRWLLPIHVTSSVSPCARRGTAQLLVLSLGNAHSVAAEHSIVILA